MIHNQFAITRSSNPQIKTINTQIKSIPSIMTTYPNIKSSILLANTNKTCIETQGSRNITICWVGSVVLSGKFCLLLQCVWWCMWGCLFQRLCLGWRKLGIFCKFRSMCCLWWEPINRYWWDRERFGGL